MVIRTSMTAWTDRKYWEFSKDFINTMMIILAVSIGASNIHKYTHIFFVYTRNIGSQHFDSDFTDKGSQTPPPPPLFSPWLCSFMVHRLLFLARCFSSSFINAVHHQHHLIAKPRLMLNWWSLKLHKTQWLFSPGELAFLPMPMLNVKLYNFSNF